MSTFDHVGLVHDITRPSDRSESPQSDAMKAFTANWPQASMAEGPSAPGTRS